jgi:C-terminal processing protease CtpA/Prc
VNKVFGINTNGNVIIEVIPGYPAARSGQLDVGDEILAINTTPVNETDDVRSMLARADQTAFLSIFRPVQNRG